MKLWAALTRAWRGWMLLLRGDPAWSQHFTLTNPGLAAALSIFLFFAFLSVAFASMGVGMPSMMGIASALVVQALSILALLLAIQITKRVLASPAPLRTLLVPGIYALVAYLVAGTVVSLIGGPALLLVWLALGYLLYRLGRVAAGWSRGVSVAFAVLTIALLVGMPVSLYMLLNPAASPL
ncbi:hypothetical protein [Devosia sp. 1566]|uniref:hypothetical protein n=1 Tax=Devosia sp. 1566 TaxID=2499144 RepID=UPI000FDC8B6E|nr:hypothetical protein [Devosia sp. 1566]